ncbi:hypothetical protein [Streptomyces vilmorinianum]|uniref:hypothetical protein n=1 Tax=Streptomyces vilmorinianum TaxID=3051092 RepID=UPI0010FB2EC4|nr:hypothetical protein [Streptomyces vilmorinianum]
MTTTRALPYAPPPGAARHNQIAVAPWVDRSSAAGAHCRLLLVHDPLRPGEQLCEVARAMLGVASGLGLAPAHQGARHIGPVLCMRHGATTVGPLHGERVLHVPGRTIILLNYGHEDCLLRVPDGNPAWAATAATLGQVHIAVALDPGSVGPGDDAASFARRSAAVGRLWTGIASVRT